MTPPSPFASRNRLVRFRLAPLRAAVLLALAFIALRVIYQALFNGLDRGGHLLVDLPQLRLPEPVQHVVLLGPITSSGIATAVASALPIAGIVLAFGAINAVLDVVALCARLSRGGPLRAVGQALVIAWATFPGLVRSAADVSRARRLRGERGPASLLVPVMERTVERAVALGASMEVRGFGSPRDGGALERDITAGTPAVELARASITYGASAGSPGAFSASWALRGDVALPRGLVLITGPTGAGKSTLLRTLSGLHQHADGGEVTGIVRVLGRDRSLPPYRTADIVGVVPQHPRLGFVAETVAEEIGFASRVQGASDAVVEIRVREVATRLGVAHLLEANTAHLSAGESHLVAVAAAIAHGPRLLLVDEPLADLDLASRNRVIQVLVELATGGITVVVAEHRAAALAPHAQTLVTIEPDDDGGARLRQAAPVRSEGASAPAPELPAERAERAERGAVALCVRDVHIAFGDRVLLQDTGLEARSGEIVAIAGDVGSGKTSLLNALALPNRGHVEVDGEDLATVRRRARPTRLSLVPDASDDLLFRLTVAEECARSDRLAGQKVGATLARFLAFLGNSPLEGSLAASHPRDLSVGQRRLLALAVQLAGGPRVLLIDEPSRGLDPAAAALVREALQAVAEAGTAVVVATHDATFLELADRVLDLRDGALVERAAHPAGNGAGQAP